MIYVLAMALPVWMLLTWGFKTPLTPLWRAAMYSTLIVGGVSMFVWGEISLLSGALK